MSTFEGKFVRSNSPRTGVIIVSFILSNTNWFRDKTIDIWIHDVSGQRQRRMTLETHNNRSYTFNVETMGWDWAEGDVFAIVNKRGKVEQQWQCKLSEGRRGVCPSCGGTQKCSACNGEGYWLTDNYHIQKCNVCGGTGICQHCYVPTRKEQPFQGMPNMGNVQTSPRRSGRSIAAIQGEIRKAEFELARVNNMLLSYELRQDYGLFYSNQKKYALNLEHRIKALYDELGRMM